MERRHLPECRRDAKSVTNPREGWELVGGTTLIHEGAPHGIRRVFMATQSVSVLREGSRQNRRVTSASEASFAAKPYQTKDFGVNVGVVTKGGGQPVGLEFVSGGDRKLNEALNSWSRGDRELD
jgi:hypothetical protein